MIEVYNYTEKEKHGDGFKRFSINLDSIKTIKDIKEVLKLCNINVDFTNEDLITDKNKHLILVHEDDYER